MINYIILYDISVINYKFIQKSLMCQHKISYLSLIKKYFEKSETHLKKF
jgi:hypothetical protein